LAAPQLGVAPDDAVSVGLFRWPIELVFESHSATVDRLEQLVSSIRGKKQRMAALAASLVLARWESLATEPTVLTHNDFWSGNTVWQDGTLTGVVDWSGAALGPRAFDLGWCRLDLYLLFDQYIGDRFLESLPSGERSGLL
jgi:aminoglycoside phosphotransferase (APT) family kinase protein